MAALDAPWPFDVIVVVDGSTDGTADALRAMETPFPLTIREQPNGGSSMARNAGVAAATGDLVLLLDDDMEPDPDLLLAHDRAHRKGADVVIGHIPMHPESPPSIVSDGVRAWAERRAERLSDSEGDLGFADLITGQMSIGREQLAALGGFDTGFTAGGTFGGEDTDLLHRAKRAGLRIAFAEDAVSWQYYVVTPRHYLRQWHQAGAADALVIQKHPELADEIAASHHADWRIIHRVLRPLARHPGVARPVRAVCRQLALAVAASPRHGRRGRRFFFAVRNFEYWSGFENARGAL